MGMLVAVLSGFLIAAAAPWLHRRGRARTGVLLAMLPLVLTVYFAGWIPHVGREGSIRIVYEWVPALDANLSFLIDGLSLLFALLISAVGVAIFVYSGEYMRDHPHGGRYYSFMLLFMASMLGLVLADNVITLYVFFELTSITSFLLIGLDHRSDEARRAAWQALLVTAAGGIALLAALLLLASITGSYEVSHMLDQGGSVRAAGTYLPILALVLMAAFTKSAQFPFYFWLPNAMAAPTPVSAYLHSATMVKAGVYLLARFSPVLGGTVTWTAIVTTTGAVTMVAGAYLALRYTNLKRILAYSTIMALGLLTMLLGIGSDGAILACMTFVIAHAFYKAPLFMAAGTLDHETGTYDVEELGGLGRSLPLTFAAAAAAALSMAGMPTFLGFVGKESVFAALLDAGAGWQVLLTAAVLANAAIVAAAGLVAVRPFLGSKKPHMEANRRTPAGLWVPTAALAVLGLLFGAAPGVLSRHFVAPAAGSVLGAPQGQHLELWHGLTPELWLSAVTIALGIGLFLAWNRMHRSAPMRAFAALLGAALDRGYDLTIAGLTKVAAWQTRMLQHGFLRHYSAATLGAGLLLIGFTFFTHVPVPRPGPPTDVPPYELAIAGLLVSASAAVIIVRQRFTAVLSLSVAGIGIAALFLIFSAPDAAMVQLLVETLTIILVILALVDMPKRYHELGPDRWRYRNFAIAAGTGAVVTLLMLAVLEIPFDESAGHFYFEQSGSEGHGRNVVNVILIDFRAFDTLGEITVLVAAGLSAYALVLGRGLARDRRGEESASGRGRIQTGEENQT